MGSVSSAVPPHLWPRVGLRCLTSQADSRQLPNQLHGGKERENKAGSDTARPPLGTDAASSTSSKLISPSHTQTHTRCKNTRAPQKSQVGIRLLSRMEGLPSPSTFLPKLPQLQDQKQGSTQHAAVGQLHKPTDPNTPLSRHDPEARSHSV